MVLHGRQNQINVCALTGPEQVILSLETTLVLINQSILTCSKSFQISYSHTEIQLSDFLLSHLRTKTENACMV